MKTPVRILAATFAAVMATAALSGCNVIRQLTDIVKQEETTAPRTSAVATTAPQTTAAPTTAAATTEPPTTEAPTTEAPATEAPPTAAPPSNDADYPLTYQGATLVTTPYYTDNQLGITFYMPAWQNRVYARARLTETGYSLGFYEASNLMDGDQTMGYSGMGFLFSVATSEQEAEVDIYYPAGSILYNGERVYLTYFKPTDVRFNTGDATLTQNYQEVYQPYYRSYFESGVVSADREYQPSSKQNAITLHSE